MNVVHRTDVDGEARTRRSTSYSTNGRSVAKLSAGCARPSRFCEAADSLGLAARAWIALPQPSLASAATLKGSCCIPQRSRGTVLIVRFPHRIYNARTSQKYRGGSCDRTWRTVVRSVSPYPAANNGRRSEQRALQRTTAIRNRHSFGDHPDLLSSVVL